MALLVLGAMFSLSVNAAISDTIHPFVGVSYAYDDNLFRLSDNNPQRASDTIKSTIVGVAFERPLGRQVFTGNAKLSRVDFNNFDELNYNGKDANLTWRWALGNHLDGTAGATYSETLSPFSDFHTTERNLRTSRGEFFDGGWRFHPSWRVRGRVSNDKFRYDLASQRYLDRDEDRAEAGFDYLAPSGSTIGLQVRRTKGDYLHPSSFGGVIDDEGFKQTDVQLKVLWIYSGLTQIQFLGGRARREHNLFSQRDSSGTNGRLDARWAATEKLRVTLAAWREFQPFEGSVATYTMSKGVGLTADWAITSKLQAQASVRRSTRDFDGVVGGGSSLAGTQQDRSTNGSIGLTYAPLPQLSINASLTRDIRSSETVFSTQYRARGASLSANLQF